ncbi:ubiquinone biosynthesis protein [Myriangium duriaei CBS 260.36]|uniref:Ubiquinone biosynthesis protein n=1 Tax=Myriangium duriaei CBS 260.36 TaxID=1168546 RepID=A0A9P4J536_9PEZI|nr:ubiquinone biosynthesis protein [Myriangium duriaei CBS 260.36]
MSRCRYFPGITRDFLGGLVRPRASQFRPRDSSGPARRYATEPAANQKSSTRSKRFLYTAGGLLVVGAAAVSLSDQARHLYRGAQRSGRVVTTLYLCIQDYRTVLNSPHDDPEHYNALLKACHQRCADRTFVVLEKNGSIFVKLGQHLSSLNYLLPAEWCDTFVPLQDKCPVSSYESVAEMVIKDTGKPLEEYFSEFNPQPIGAASLAQVHIARLKDTGEEVAVKIQHPALDEWADMDLALTKFTFRTLARWFPEYDLTWLSEEMQYSLPKELDFAQEGQNAIEAREYFSHIKELPVVIPKVHWAQRRILVMEKITGRRPDDLNYLDSNGIDRDEVSAALARIFNEMIFGNNAPLHCDPHGGNIAIRLNPTRRAPGNFDVVLYDHGLYRNPPLDLRRNYAKLWLAVLDADEPRMRKYAHAVAGITDEQFPLFASAITGRDYNVITSSISKPRDDVEKAHISEALGDGLIEQLITLLGQVPRVILLILKTNDLTRSLDENLHTRQGPIRSFLILARYASRTVYEEQLENLKGSLFNPRNFWRFLVAWSTFEKVQWKLTIYEYWLRMRSLLGMQPAM